MEEELQRTHHHVDLPTIQSFQLHADGGGSSKHRKKHHKHKGTISLTSNVCRS